MFPALKGYNCEYVEGATNSDCKDNLRDDFLADAPYTKETTKLGQRMLNMTSKCSVIRQGNGYIFSVSGLITTILITVLNR